MVKKPSKQKKLKKLFLGIFVLGALLVPVSLSVQTGVEHSPIVSLTPNVAHAWPFEGLTESILNAIGYTIISIGGAFTWMGGAILDFAIQQVVIGFGDFVNNTGLGVTINTVWELVRDICNLLFIFGFIYLGIKTIYDYESSSTKKMLATLIIAALLINFSLFITKFIVEFSNILAYTVYNAFGITADVTIAARIMDILGLSSFWGPGTVGVLDSLTGGGALWFYIMAFVFLIIAAFIFLSGALMLISRFVGLLFIMMFSPILFAAQIFPQTKQYTKMIWDKLLSYSFYAPAYLFLILVSILVLDKIPFKGGKFAQIAELRETTTEAAQMDVWGVVLNFIIAIMVLQTAGTLAQKFGLAGSAIAIKIADKGKGVVRGMAGGTAGFVGRNTVGRASRGILKKYDRDVAQMAGKEGFRGGLNRFLTMAPVDKALRGTLESGKKAKFGSSNSLVESDAYNEQMNKRRTGDKAELDRLEVLKKATDKEAGMDPNPETTAENVRKLTVEQMKNMGLELLANENIALHLSYKQLEELEKTGKYSDNQIEKIKEGKKKAVEQIISGDKNQYKKQKQLLMQNSFEELAKMSNKLFTSGGMAGYLTPDILEAKLKTNKLNEDELKKLGENIDESITNALEDGETVIAGRMQRQWSKWKEKSVRSEYVDFKNLTAVAPEPAHKETTEENLIVMSDGKPWKEEKKKS